MVCAQAISQGCVRQVTLRDELMSASGTCFLQDEGLPALSAS